MAAILHNKKLVFFERRNAPIQLSPIMFQFSNSSHITAFHYIALYTIFTIHTHNQKPQCARETCNISKPLSKDKNHNIQNTMNI